MNSIGCAPGSTYPGFPIVVSATHYCFLLKNPCLLKPNLQLQMPLAYLLFFFNDEHFPFLFFSALNPYAPPLIFYPSLHFEM